MQDYMLLYKGGDKDWMTKSTPEEMAATMEKWGAWMGMLQEKNQLVSGGSPLDYSGKNLTSDGVITDVSQSEIKELVTGYSIVRAEDMSKAIEIAKACPIFLYPECTVDIREVSNPPG